MTWKQELTNTAQAALQNPKVAWTVTGATGVSGSIAKWIDGVLGGIGAYAISISAILSLVLIYNHIVGGINKRKIERAEFEKLQLEIKALKGDKDG